MAEFGHFEILGVLGSGGMGKVYRAKNNEKDRTVALKLMQREMLQAPDFRARFDKEAKINSSLKHPNIVEVFDHGIINNRPFIEMELLPNGSLHDLFHVPNVFRLSRASELLKGVAAGLDYAHGRGIIHRDIKLGNVLLAEDNVPKLVDFGLARAVFETHMTRTSAMLGTPLYMSPEQAISARDIDFRADIYSLAVMAYLLATGHFPFYDDKLLVVLNQHVQMMPPLPTEVNPALPKAMMGCCSRGWRRTPMTATRQHLS
ncbi:MAG: serine/threonine-protein kinase [Chloroflexota bacterium]